MKPRSAPLPSSPEGRDASATVSLCVCTSRDFESSCTTVTPKGGAAARCGAQCCSRWIRCVVQGGPQSQQLSSRLLRGHHRLLFSCLWSVRCVGEQASAYYTTPLLPGDDTNGAAEAKPIDAQVAELFGSNAVAPLFLIRAVCPQAGRGECVEEPQPVGGQPLRRHD
ncbi:hypothetical protein TcBrA4_0065700 [Trypanosoma cruzi]|nr:hypothetical protein TcBrA4_0065700 [Trypanosoma cruzi]